MIYLIPGTKGNYQFLRELFFLRKLITLQDNIQVIEETSGEILTPASSSFGDSCH